MGSHWDKMDEYIDKLKDFTEDEILSILKKTNMEMLKYYSGFACELCNPRSLDGVDLKKDETGESIVRVRHEWSSTYQKIYIIQ